MNKRMSGFTLIELLVTIVIMGIMATFAFSGMTKFVANARLANRTEQVANLFRFAKSEAVRLGVPVVICGVQVRSDGRPSGSCSNTQMNSGMFAYADKNRNGTYEANIDTSLRTISINNLTNSALSATVANTASVQALINQKTALQADKKFKVAILPSAYAIQTTGALSKTTISPEFIFMPNGAFGGKPNSGDMLNLQLGSRFIRFDVVDIDSIDTVKRTASVRTIVVSSTSVIITCSVKNKTTKQSNDNNFNGLTDAQQNTLCAAS